MEYPFVNSHHTCEIPYSCYESSHYNNSHGLMLLKVLDSVITKKMDRVTSFWEEV